MKKWRHTHPSSNQLPIPSCGGTETEHVAALRAPEIAFPNHRCLSQGFLQRLRPWRRLAAEAAVAAQRPFLKALFPEPQRRGLCPGLSPADGGAGRPCTCGRGCSPAVQPGLAPADQWREGRSSCLHGPVGMTAVSAARGVGSDVCTCGDGTLRWARTP